MKNYFSSIIVKKGLLTLFFIFIYVLGSHLTLPFVDVNNRDFLGGSAAYLAFSTAIVGGNLRSLSIFSVGLSPWMSSMILWQIFSFSKKLGLNNGAIETQNRRQMYLTLFIALIQALAVSLNLPIQSQLPSIFILITSMVLNIPYDLIESSRTIHLPWFILVPILLMGIIFTYLVAILYRARYRIAVNKIGLHNRFNRYSYFDIMLNPAGAMPYMYVMTFLSLPNYLLLLLQTVFPNHSVFAELSAQFTIGKPLWIYMYIVILFIFSIAFAFVNMSGEQISDRMKKSGEYIYGVYPGEETSRFVNQLVFRFSIIGAVLNVIMAGGPMLFVLFDEKLLKIAMIPGLFMMFGGMIFTVRDEISALRLNETYKPLI